MGYEKRDSDVVSIQIKDRGYYQTTALGMDMAIAKYLPASVEILREVLKSASDNEDDYSDIHTVTECLFILSEYDGNNR